MTNRTPARESLDPIERASRDEITALQLERLRDTLTRAYEHVPHYRKSFDAAGVHPGDVRSLADEDLVPLMARGEARAFEAIYERHSGAAYSLAYRMVGARAVAEDVTQEAFLNLWRSGAHYDRSRGSVRTWILGIVHHRAIDALRRNSVHSKRRSDDETAAERLESPERVEEDVARKDEANLVE